MMSIHRILKADILLLMVVGLGLLATAAFITTNSKAKASNLPLIGSMIHDFGIVRLDNKLSPLTHTFSLRNQSDSSIEIKKISSTCGCTEASTDVNRILPGEIVRVSATLSMTESGFKQAEINIVTDSQEQSIITLVLRASGRRNLEYMVLDRSINIQLGDSAQITIYAIDYESDNKPSTPMISTSQGITASFNNWQLVHKSYKSSGQPARWQGRIDVIAVSLEPNRDNASITISSDQSSPAISIPVEILDKIE